MRFGGVGQWIGAVDHRGELSGLDQLSEVDEIVGRPVEVGGSAEDALPSHEGRPEHLQELPDAEHGHKIAALGTKGALDLGHRRLADRIEDDVVGLAAPGEVLLRVVDDLVGAKGRDEGQVASAADPRDPSAEGLGELYGRRTYRPGSAIDEDALSGLELRH